MNIPQLSWPGCTGNLSQCPPTIPKCSEGQRMAPAPTALGGQRGSQVPGWHGTGRLQLPLGSLWDSQGESCPFCLALECHPGCALPPTPAWWGAPEPGGLAEDRAVVPGMPEHPAATCLLPKAPPSLTSSLGQGPSIWHRNHILHDGQEAAELFPAQLSHLAPSLPSSHWESSPGSSLLQLHAQEARQMLAGLP